MTTRQTDEYKRLLAEDGFTVGDGDLVYRVIAGAEASAGFREISPAGAGSPSTDWLSRVLEASPGNRFALVLRGPFTKEASLLKGGVRPCLDDMAQMLGPRLAVRERGGTPFRLGVNSAVLLRGEGAVLAADSWYELHALALVVEKSCLAAVAAPLLGGAQPISFVESVLMRYIYLSKYRKTAGRARREATHG